jgi:transposase-like protein
MQIELHANATTTPHMRSYIQQSRASVADLAQELGISQTTVRRWKERQTVFDGSHTRHDLAQSTSAEEEALIVELRQNIGLGLDDIVEVMTRCVNASLSRSAVYRCLRRHGIASRPAEPKASKPGTFEAASFGFVHVDLKHLPKLQRQAAYVFVAIERVTRFVHAEIIQSRDAETVAACLGRFLTAFKHPVHTILTDNGSEFTDRFAVEMKNKPADKPSGRHAFDRVCAANDIEHRLTKPFHPQTNGMVERFNRRLAEVIRQHPAVNKNGCKNKFLSHEQRNRFITDFVHAYNRTRLRCLSYRSPIETLHNHTEQYTFAGMTGEM